MRFNFDVRAAITTFLGILVLSGLGLWQVQRLHWKEGIIARMQAQMAQPAQPLPENVEATEWTFRQASVTGTFLHDREMLLQSRVQNGVAGVELITPLARVSGGTVLVNRGWILEKDVARAPRPDGIVQVRGLVRGNFERGMFTPVNNAPSGKWYWEDIPAMTQGLSSPLPVIVFAGADDSKILIGGQGVPVLPNDHLQYAFFWFIMAFTLLIIYVVFSIEKVDHDGLSKA